MSDWKSLFLVLGIGSVIFLMEGRSIVLGKRERLKLGAASSGDNEEDDEETRRRKKQPLSKECNQHSISLVRELIMNIIAGLKGAGLTQNKNNKRWNSVIEEAFNDRFGYSKYNWGKIKNFTTIIIELYLDRENSSFFKKVIELIKGKE